MSINSISVQDVNFARAPGKYVDARVLAANTAETVTVPEVEGVKAQYVMISSQLSKDYYVNFNGATAAIPSADITDGSSPELNPENIFLGDMASFSVIAPEATILTLTWYK